MTVRRLGLVALLALLPAFPLAFAPTAGARAPAPVRVELVRSTGFHLGGRSFGSRPRGSFLGRRTRSTRSRGILRRIAHALAFAALLHFLFAGSGGLGFIFLLLLIVGLVVLIRRRRRRVQTRW